MTNSERHADVDTRYGDFGARLEVGAKSAAKNAQNAFKGALGRIHTDCRRRTIPKAGMPENDSGHDASIARNCGGNF